jgi:alpha-glucosidase
MMIIADRPGGLIESTLELNLNEPCKIKDTSWIETGKYIGIWWAIHLKDYTWSAGPKHGATTENTMRYMDFAAEHGFNGVLVEGWNEGWGPGWMTRLDNFSFTKAYPDFDIERVCSYGLSKGVRLIGHHETGGAIANYEAQLDDAFALYQSNGVRAVKTGYVGRRASDMREMMDAKELNTSQFGVRHFQKVLETAAKHQLMVISHESIMQTGLRRTWPNMMASENLRGQEYNAWSKDGGNPPVHLATIPFTRGLAGPIDFTPGIVNFDYETVPGTRVQTTVAKQLSLYVVIYSPWQMAADLPENYEGHPALKFIEHVPTNWKTTQVLDGAIGDFITVARKDRNSEKWYVGSLTDENPRDVHIPLKFLDAGCSYTAEIYRDGPDADWKTNPESLVVESRTVTSDDTLDLHLAASGGLAVRLVPQK